MAWKLSETLITVSDLDAALAFHIDKLGFSLIEKQEWGFALLTPDGASRIGLLAAASGNPNWKDGDPLPAPCVALRTDDIEAEVRRLETAGVDVDPVQGEAGTLRAVGFRDQDGIDYFLWDDGSGEL